jgi:hypothetical protein
MNAARLVTDVTVGALLDAIADRVAARINARAERDTYSSRDLPPRCTRRNFAEVCRHGYVEGARREGRDWVCSREAWNTARSRPAPPKPATTAAESSLIARADALLQRKKLRLIEGFGRGGVQR